MAERGAVWAGRKAEAGLVGGGCGENEGIVGRELQYEVARIAGRHDHQCRLDVRLLRRCAEVEGGVGGRGGGEKRRGWG